jgi:hypothetical protein
MASKNSVYGSGIPGFALRAMRAQNGISRPPALALARLHRLGWRSFMQVVAGRPVVLWHRAPGSQVGPAERRRRRRFARMLAEVMPGGGKLVMTAEGVSVSSVQPLSRDPVTGHLRIRTGD